MAELADALRSGRSELYAHAGSTPAFGTGESCASASQKTRDKRVFFSPTMTKIVNIHTGKFKKVAKGFLSIGMLAAFFFYIPLRDIYNTVQSVDAKLFLGSFFLGFPALYLGAVKLWFLARKQGISLFIYQIYKINLIVKFYSFFSPVSIVGSGLKWYKLSSQGKEAEALSAIAFSRVWDIFIAVFFGLLWVLLGLNFDIIHPGFLTLFLLLLVGGWFIVMKVSPALSKWAISKALVSKKKIVIFLFSSMGKLLDTLSVYRNFSTKDFSFLIITSSLKEILALIGHTILASALGIRISFVDLGWMRSIFFLSALAPFTMAGGIGLREVSVVLVMSAFGIDAKVAAAYSFLFYARSVLLHLPGGLIELLSTFLDKGKS